MTEDRPASVPLSDVTVVLLVGGRGTRIGNIYPNLPKPLVPVLGRPFLFWLTTYLAEFGLTDFVYSTGHMGDQIDAWTQNTEFPSLNRRTCYEATPLGTGGGVQNCIPCCSRWMLVVNGDGLCLSGIEALLNVRNEENISGGLIGVYAEDAERYGSLSIDESGMLSSFREKVSGSGHINSGIYLFETRVLQALGEVRPMSMESDIIPQLIADGHKLRVVQEMKAPFIDIGTPETLAQAEHFISTHFPALI